MRTEDVVALVWVGVGAVGFLAWLVVVGADYQRDGVNLGIKDGADAMGASFVGMVAALLWPFAVLAAPFFAGRAVGMLIERRDARRKRERAEEHEALRRARDAFDRSEPEWDLLNAALQETDR